MFAGPDAAVDMSSSPDAAVDMFVEPDAALDMAASSSTRLEVTVAYTGSDHTIGVGSPLSLTLVSMAGDSTERILSAAPTGPVVFESLAPGGYQIYAFLDGDGDGMPSDGDSFHIVSGITVIADETATASFSFGDAYQVHGTFDIQIDNFPMDGPATLTVERRSVLHRSTDVYVSTESDVTVDFSSGSGRIRLTNSLSGETDPDTGRMYMLRLVWDRDAFPGPNDGGDDQVATLAEGLVYIGSSAPYSFTVDWAVDAEVYSHASSIAPGQYVNVTVEGGAANETPGATANFLLLATYTEANAFTTQTTPLLIPTDGSGDGAALVGSGGLREGNVRLYLVHDANEDGDYTLGEPVSAYGGTRITPTGPYDYTFSTWHGVLP